MGAVITMGNNNISFRIYKDLIFSSVYHLYDD